MARVTTHPGVAEIRGRNGRILKRHRDGTFHTSPEVAKRLARNGEAEICPDMNTATSRSEGYRCVDCGFGTWFTTCSRCGGEAHRETDA